MQAEHHAGLPDLFRVGHDVERLEPGPRIPDADAITLAHVHVLAESVAVQDLGSGRRCMPDRLAGPHSIDVRLL